MNELPKLYGYDINNRLKEWSVRTEGNKVIVTHGLVGGKKQESITISLAKNIGKSNQTTPEQQAILDAKSKWKKQKDKNYHEDKDNIVPLSNPMLAKDYNKTGHKIVFPCYAQPKLDGCRALISFDGSKILYKSRGGKTYPNIPEIDAELGVIFNKNPDIVLDGELYCHGLHLQDIVSAIKKHNENTSKISFVIFDIAEEGEVWEKRANRLSNLKKFSENRKFSRVHVLSTIKVVGDDHVVRLHKAYVDSGYEGVILRNTKGKYRYNYRSFDLQKYKTFIDEEFEVVGVEKDAHNHGVCVLVCPETGNQFKAKLAGTDEARLDVWTNRDAYIGSYATIQYQTRTKDGLPQFPVLKCFRDVCKKTLEPLE